MAKANGIKSNSGGTSPSPKMEAKRSKNLMDVELGFAEEQDSWRLESHFFPSKIGGYPAWLNLAEIPTANDVKCGGCSKCCIFLLQIYAPDSQSEESFHRTIFLFVCRNPDCNRNNSAQNFIVLRSQLKRTNEFFSDQPIDPDFWDPEAKNLQEKGKFKRASDLKKLCCICGLAAGEKHCGECGLRFYCSKEHQEIHWRSGHKSECAQLADPNSDSVKNLKPLIPAEKNPIIFPEYELITERENYVEKQEKERPESDRLKDYENFLKTKTNGVLLGNSGGTGGGADLDLDELESLSKKLDKDFKQFQRRIGANPDQIVRYQRGGDPLFASPVKPAQIPDCILCKSPRNFEFQLMPQLLAYLDVDSVEKSIDWATVLVYTCKRSCSFSKGYASEFLFKQDYAE